MAQPDPVPVRSLPTSDELRAWLAADQDGPRVTVTLPIQRGPESRQNARFLAHAVAEVEERLRALGAPTDPAAALARIDLALARLPHGTRGIVALHDARGGPRAIGIRDEIAYGVTVGRHFALRPLLAAQQRHAAYRVLAVSVNRVAHFEGGPEGLREAPLPGVPTSLSDALGDELTEVQFRVRGPGPAGSMHGSGREERKLDLVRFHEALARTLAPALADDPLPIVLAATEEHQGGLRALAKLPGLLDEGVPGNFDHASPAELAARCAPLVEAWLARRAAECAGAWERARNRGKGVDLLDDVGAAAIAGRVARLWVDASRSLPGRLDPATGRVELDAGDGDVLDALCEAVLARGGEVIPVAAEQLPSPTGAAAELR